MAVSLSAGNVILMVFLVIVAVAARVIMINLMRRMCYAMCGDCGIPRECRESPESGITNRTYPEQMMETTIPMPLPQPHAPPPQEGPPPSYNECVPQVVTVNEVKQQPPAVSLKC